MDWTEQLVSIERMLWTGGAEAYRRHLDDDCLIAFTAELAGVSTREDVADSVEGAPRWREPEMEVRGVIRPTDDVAILTYLAKATRQGGERYRALVTSGYVLRDGDWKLTFHQQTPLGE